MGTEALDNLPATCAGVLSEVSGLKCDRMLQRLRYVWASRHSWDRSQTQLEDHNFTAATTKPSIPLLLLLEVGGPEALHDAARESYFWSRTPIPALLHVCRESRHAMQLCGYELAFAAEESEPRVWFNFKHDVLYLTGELCWRARSVHHRAEPDYFELPCKDSGRIQKLAVADDWGGRYDILGDTIPKLPCLKELLWVISHIPAGNGHGIWDNWGHKETEADLWGYLECDTMEFIDPKVIGGYLPCCEEWSSGLGGLWDMYFRDLQGYRRTNKGSADGYFTLKLTEVLSNLQELKKVHPGSWPIPDIKMVFILTKKQAGLILDGRQRFLQRMREVEMFEDEEGPRLGDRLFGPRRRSLDAPFMDECDVLHEWYSYEHY